MPLLCAIFVIVGCGMIVVGQTISYGSLRADLLERDEWWSKRGFIILFIGFAIGMLNSSVHG